MIVPFVSERESATIQVIEVLLHTEEMHQMGRELSLK